MGGAPEEVREKQKKKEKKGKMQPPTSNAD